MINPFLLPDLLTRLCTALLLTVAIELDVALFFGYWRDKVALIAIILINLITNPLLIFLVGAVHFYYFWMDIVFWVILELVVVLIEWALLYFVLREDKIKLLVLSIVMNLASVIFGAILSTIFYEPISGLIRHLFGY